jgi:hypothetical protein
MAEGGAIVAVTVGDGRIVGVLLGVRLGFGVFVGAGVGVNVAVSVAALVSLGTRVALGGISVGVCVAVTGKGVALTLGSTIGVMVASMGVAVSATCAVAGAHAAQTATTIPQNTCCFTRISSPIQHHNPLFNHICAVTGRGVGQASHNWHEQPAKADIIRGMNYFDGDGLMKKWIRAGIVALGLWMLAAILITPTIVSEAQVQQGTNWTGAFFNSTDLSGAQIASASYPTGISQNWVGGIARDGANNVVPGVPATNWSARFSSVQTLPAGNYTFTIVYDDGVRFKIDNTTVIDDFTGGSVRTRTAQVAITGGVYTLTVEFLQNTFDAVLQVSWTTDAVGVGTPGVVGTVGPTATPAPIATGIVERVRGLAVRTGPYIGTTLVAVARPGTTYTVLAQNKSEGPFTWYLIQVSDTKQGWASGRYLTVSGNLAAVPTQATIFDQIDAAPDINVIGQTRSVMNIRVRPSERTAKIGEVPWGAQVSIIGRTRQGGRDFWYQIRYNGVVGWILASFVGVRDGFIDAVPVR